jgi:hypothetical protein
MYRLCILLGMYAVIVVIDQLMLQPLIMKRVTRVPVWASILAPIVLGIVIPFWGILLAPPLLAIVYAFRRPRPLAALARHALQAQGERHKQRLQPACYTHVSSPLLPRRYRCMGSKILGDLLKNGRT